MRVASAIIALIGLAIATYLTAVHYSGAAPTCAIGHGCSTVQSSRYAALAGVPVAALGVAGYLALLLTLLGDGERARAASAFVAMVGAGFSAWLTYAELFVLRAVCSWCLASAGCMAALAALAVARVWPRG